MRPVFSLLLFLVGIYVLLAVMFYLMQNRMVFLANMPGRALTATPQDAGFAYQDVGKEREQDAVALFSYSNGHI